MYRRGRDEGKGRAGQEKKGKRVQESRDMHINSTRMVGKAKRTESKEGTGQNKEIHKYRLSSTHDHNWF